MTSPDSANMQRIIAIIRTSTEPLEYAMPATEAVEFVLLKPDITSRYLGYSLNLLLFYM